MVDVSSLGAFFVSCVPITSMRHLSTFTPVVHADFSRTIWARKFYTSLQKMIPAMYERSTFVAK